MLVTRAAHTATLLEDGRVLLAAGCIEHSCEGITDTTEVVDTTTGVASPGPTMTEVRVGHRAVSLPDGRHFLLGGFGADHVTSSTESLDAAAKVFLPGPSMTQARADPAALLLQDGTVLVAGGFDGRRPLATAEIFDPASNRFRPTGSLALARTGAAAILLDDGRVLVAGGNAGADGGTGSAVQATAELYDPKSGTWSPTGSMTVRRHKHAAIKLDDGHVLVLGGSDERDGEGVYRSAEIYDPTAGTFTASADMVSGRYKIEGAVVRLGNGRVLVAGGADPAELFDPPTSTFAPVNGDTSTAWSFATATLLRDGSVLVAGGYDRTITLTDAISRYRP